MERGGGKGERTVFIVVVVVGWLGGWFLEGRRDGLDWNYELRIDVSNGRDLRF